MQERIPARAGENIRPSRRMKDCFVRSPSTFSIQSDHISLPRSLSSPSQIVSNTRTRVGSIVDVYRRILCAAVAVKGRFSKYSNQLKIISLGLYGNEECAPVGSTDVAIGFSLRSNRSGSRPTAQSRQKVHVRTDRVQGGGAFSANIELQENGWSFAMLAFRL